MSTGIYYVPKLYERILAHLGYCSPLQTFVYEVLSFAGKGFNRNGSLTNPDKQVSQQWKFCEGHHLAVQQRQNVLLL